MPITEIVKYTAAGVHNPFNVLDKELIIMYSQKKINYM
jgi:hypothetical protein